MEFEAFSYFPPILGFGGLPFYIGFPGNAVSSVIPNSAPKAPTQKQCYVRDGKNSSIDLTCFEDRFLAATLDRPQISSYPSAPHCPRGAEMFSDRVYVTGPHQDLMEVNPSKDPKAEWLRLSCSVPSLWETANPRASQILQNGWLYYAQVQGQTVWVPDYLCNTFSYFGYTIRNEKDFEALQAALQRPFDNEERNVYACVSNPQSQLTPPALSLDSPFRKLEVFPKEATVALGNIARGLMGATAEAALQDSLNSSMGEFLLDVQQRLFETPSLDDSAAPSDAEKWEDEAEAEDWDENEEPS